MYVISNLLMLQQNYDKNSAITVVVLYLPIQKCKQNHCMESIYILNNEKTFPMSITILLFNKFAM